MNSFLVFHALEELMQVDLANRHLRSLRNRRVLEPAVQSLRQSQRVLIFTGFCLGPQLPETDGPLGAVVLGRALQCLGAEVIYICDSPVDRILADLLVVTGRPAPIHCLKEPFSAQSILDTLHPSHLIAIERPGRNTGQDYLNASGLTIRLWNEPLDDFFLIPGPWITLGIGDGGNEIGMGKLLPLLKSMPDPVPRFATSIATDHLISAGVSNWGAYALTAGLSYLEKQTLLHTPEEEASLLKAAVQAGAVDGFSRRPELSVDGIPLLVHQCIIQLFHSLIEQNPAK